MTLRWITSSLLGFMLAFGAVPALVAADDEAAQRYYEQARRETDPNRQLQLLNQSVAAQPTSVAWLAIGRIGLQARQLDLAEAAFKSAYNLADSDPDRVKALSGLAQVYFDKGDLSQARMLAKAATERAKLAGLAPPDALTQMTGQIAAARAKLPISASRIVAELKPGDATKDYNVVPSIELNIHFAYDRADLDEEGRKEVEQLAQAFQTLQQAGDLQFARLIGHTDEQGTPEYNQTLSECRASTVQREVTRRVPALAGKLCAEGKGKKELLFAERSPENDRLNRRVEIKLEPCSAGPVPDCKTVGKDK